MLQTCCAILFANYCSVALFAAGIVTVPYVPPGLNPGDTYQIFFITAQGTIARDPTIEFYDAFVDAQANLPGAITEPWGVDWSAVVATYDDQNAIANAGISAPVYALNGSLVATDSTDFWDGDHLTEFISNQYGWVNPLITNWTGMDAFGNPASPLGDPSGNSGYGFFFRKDERWAFDGTQPNDISVFVYAVSEELTVIPEPTSALFLCVTGALACLRRRR